MVRAWQPRGPATSRQHQVRVGAWGWIGKNGANPRGGWPASPLDRHFSGQDFLLAREQSVDAIVTNPPYISATRFIEHALRLMSGAAKWRCCSARTLTTPGVGTYFRNVPHSPARSSSQNVSGGSKTPPANRPAITHGTFGIISTLASQPLNTICSIEEAMRVEAGLFTRSA